MNHQISANSVGVSRLRGLFDVLTMLMCFLLVHRLYFGDLGLTPERMLVMIFSMGACYTVLTLAGMYQSSVGPDLTEEVMKLLMFLALVVLSVGLFAFLTKVAIEVSRLWFGLSTLLTFILMVLYRVALRYTVVRSRLQGNKLASIVIVGAGELGQLTMRRVVANPAAGYRIDAVFDDYVQRGEEFVPGCPVQGTTGELLPYIEQMRKQGKPVSQVWITLPLQAENKRQQIIDQMMDTSVDVCFVPDLLTVKLLAGSIDHVAELAVINISDIQLPSFGEWFKTLFDYSVALIAIIILSPIMIIVALAVVLGSPGPVLFRQRRYGIDGQEIEVWKFRTMNVQEEQATVVQATRNDNRVTRIGAYLRKTSLDELPQFFNVLQGTMSVVGPRPHAVSHNEEYRSRIAGYMMRHKIKPGITGLAQVSGWRGETDTLEKMEKRVQFDLNYIRNWSPWLDVKIILRTIVQSFRDKNAY